MTFLHFGIETYESNRTKGDEHFHKRDKLQYFKLNAENLDKFRKGIDNL